MVTRIFNKDNNTLYIKYTGVIDITAMMSHLGGLSKMALPKRLKMLTEIYDSQFIFNFTDIPGLWKEFKKMAIHYEIIYDAIVISNPRETALNILFKETSKSDPVSNYKSKVFSTHEAAHSWLEKKST